MTIGNCGKAIQELHNSNAISDNVKAELMKIHRKGNDGKHANWYSGEAYVNDNIEQLYKQGKINKEVYDFMKKINKDANNAKHPN